jgi:inner membrane protein
VASARGLAVVCALIAVIPDIDLLLGSHRTYSHSIAAVAAAAFLAWVIARRSPYARTVTVAVAAAYGSHLLLDWLGRDSSNPIGLMVWWPFSSRFYVSGVDLFKEVSRRYWNQSEFVFGNLRSVGWELLILAPIAVAAWILHRFNR